MHAPSANETAVPLAVRFRQGLYRLVDLDSGGIAKSQGGDAIDAGGGKSAAAKRKLEKQAQAVNISQQERRQKMVEAASYKKKTKRTRVKEEAMTLPVLELSGVSYGLRMLDGGEPAAIVVEDPGAYAGKAFRFAEGEGFRSLHLGAAVGPYRNLMSLPPHALRGLDCMRLRELGESRELYLLEMTEAAQLQEEGEDEPQGGMHWHEVDREEGQAEGGEQSWHRHVYLIEEELEIEGGMLPANSLIFTEFDGDHSHAIDEEGNHTEEDGPHAHAVKITLPSGEVLELQTENDGAHPHQLMVMRSGLDGLHGHALTIKGRALTSLTPAEFAALAPERGEETEAAPPQV